jgi:hypothetical protein
MWVDDNDYIEENDVNNNSMNSGLCISSLSNMRSNFTCEVLRKNTCDKYLNMKQLNINSETLINNGPCFFNGDDKDTSKLLCVRKSSLDFKECEDIKTNSMIFYDGEWKESCNEGHVIFGLSSMCGWVKRYDEGSGSCGHVYYLTENGNGIILIFYFILFYFYFYFYFIFLLKSIFDI